MNDDETITKEFPLWMLPHIADLIDYGVGNAYDRHEPEKADELRAEADAMREMYQDLSDTNEN